MAGSAILDPTVLIDSLVGPVIDGLRGSLHPAFGVRAYRLSTVLRTWTGRRIGQGTSTDVVTEILPQPKVWVWDGFEYRLEPCGIDEIGQCKLTEVSLTYTEAELLGPKPLTGAQQWLLRLTEGHGQASRERFLLHTKPPYIDREKDMGWVLWLRSVSA